ncbi:MAG: Rne/Rng family ribonuclease [Alphaproteobacteria bacterium]|nr:Rne/Rng family ribonuclease [Alphaproteobacteria bacterium]
MTDEILINVGPREIRAALIEAERPVEVWHWRRDQTPLLGRIHLGRVTGLAPGADAAFVDFGGERAGFLSLRDDRLEEGQAVLVQVAKEPYADKGASLTMDLSLPGRFLALRPLQPGIALSRQIKDKAERARLLALGESLAESEGLAEIGGGFILRTAAEGADEAALSAEAAALVERWRRLDREAGTARPPALLYADDDPIRRCLREQCCPKVRRVLIDDGEALASARDYCTEMMPWAAERLARHTGAGALFDLYDTEAEIEAALEPHLDLPSGGSIAIEATEALTAIDVNAGRLAGGRDAAETALATNLEAAAEMARQLRLRAIGGLIVIDFIDMNAAGAVARLLAALDAALARDRAPTRRSEMSAFGLVEMTRRRDREPLAARLTEPCPGCAGGRRPSARAIAERALRLAAAEARRAPGGRIEDAAAPEVIADLGGEAGGRVEWLGRRLGCRLGLRATPERGREAIDVYRP